MFTIFFINIIIVHQEFLGDLFLTTAWQLMSTLRSECDSKTHRNIMKEQPMYVFYNHRNNYRGKIASGYLKYPWLQGYVFLIFGKIFDWTHLTDVQHSIVYATVISAMLLLIINSFHGNSAICPWQIALMLWKELMIS